MSEIAACTLIQEEPDRKTERYMMMFKDYPDVVSVDILQEMLGICRKNAYLLVKQNKIHSARVGRSYHPDQNGTADDVQPPTGPQKRPEQKCAGGGRLRQRQDEILA